MQQIEDVIAELVPQVLRKQSVTGGNRPRCLQGLLLRWHWKLVQGRFNRESVNRRGLVAIAATCEAFHAEGAEQPCCCESCA